MASGFFWFQIARLNPYRHLWNASLRYPFFVARESNTSARYLPRYRTEILDKIDKKINLRASRFPQNLSIQPVIYQNTQREIVARCLERTQNNQTSCGTQVQFSQSEPNTPTQLRAGFATPTTQDSRQRLFWRKKSLTSRNILISRFWRPGILNVVRSSDDSRMKYPTSISGFIYIEEILNASGKVKPHYRLEYLNRTIVSASGYNLPRPKLLDLHPATQIHRKLPIDGVRRPDRTFARIQMPEKGDDRSIQHSSSGGKSARSQRQDDWTPTEEKGYLWSNTAHRA